MLFPDRREPENGITPGLMPSIHDGEPSTQKSVPAASPDLPASDPDVFWLRMALYIALWIWEPEGWVFALLLLGIVVIPAKMLDQLSPMRLIPRSWRQQPRVIQTDSGDTWITHVPSIVVENADRNVRLPFRVMSGLIALVSMILATSVDDGNSLLVRITFFLSGMIFGGIALVPDGDLRRLLPRISTAPRISAPAGDADAGQAGGADFQNSRSGLKIDG